MTTVRIPPEWKNGTEPVPWREVDQLLRDENPEFAALVDRTEFAHNVAIALFGYRIDNKLTQTAVAKQLGVSQPWVNKLEMGEHVPTIETLIKISRLTGRQFAINIGPETKTGALLTVKAKANSHSYSDDGVAVTTTVV